MTFLSGKIYFKLLYNVNKLTSNRFIRTQTMIFKRAAAVALFLLALAPTVSAQDPGGQVAELLDIMRDGSAIAATDLSVGWARIIFGDIALAAAGQAPLPDHVDHVLGAISAIFNVGMLFFAALITSYSGFMSVLSAAGRGNFTKDAEEGMWLGLRTSVALGALIPLASGYSAFQYMVLWVAMKGVALANIMFIASLTFFNSFGSNTLQNVNWAHTTSSIAGAAKTIQACRNSLSYHGQRGDPGTNNRNWDVVFQPRSDPSTSGYMASNRHQFDAYVKSRWSSRHNTRLSRVCGEIDPPTATVSSQSNFTSAVVRDYINAQGATFQQAVNRLNDVMGDIIFDYKDTQTTFDPLAYESRLQDWYDSISEDVRSDRQIIVDYMIENDILGGNDGMMDTALSLGWAYWGVYYWDLIRDSEDIEDVIRIRHQFTSPRLLEVDSVNGRWFSDAQETYNEALNDIMPQIYATGIVPNPGAAGSRNVHDHMPDPESMSEDDLGDLEPADIGWSAMRVAMWVIQDLYDDNGNNPVDGAANLGRNIVYIGATVATTSFLLRAKVHGAEKSAAGMIAGLFGAKTWSYLAYNILGWAMAISISLIPVGAVLAFYLPMMPFIQWIWGVVGWLIILTVSVAAAPVWVAAHTMPEGRGIAGQHARQGYMIQLNCFLKPGLMLFGGYASMYLLIAAGDVLNTLFLPMLLSINMDSGLIAIILIASILSLYTTLLVNLASRCFSLIQEIPAQIPRFIGGGQEQLGDGQKGAEHAEASAEQSGRRNRAAAETVASTGSGPKGGGGGGGNADPNSGKGRGTSQNAT